MPGTIRLRPAFAVTLALLVLVASSASLSAQIVRGTLTETGTEEPVSGSVVVLLDGAGARRAGTLTNEAGRFTLRAPAAGEYRLRAERVGYRSVTSPPFRLAAGEERELPLRMPVEAISLAGISVQAEQRCRVRPSEGVAASAVWDEARKALDATALLQEERTLRFRTRSYQRVLDPSDRRVRQENAKTATGHYTTPFVSVPAERLAEHGFVEETPEGFVYYAPDAEVLLSDAFLDTHCFRLVERPDSAHLIGLAFEPASGRRLPEIRGTFWLERDSAALRFLEYEYTNLELAVQRDALGGRVEFDRLRDGGWLVRRWNIRMPVVQTRFVTFGTERQRRSALAAIHETGGEVLEARREGAVALQAGPKAILSGVVFDSTRQDALAGARVVLRGTEHGAATDSLGRFRITGVAGGRYRVEVLGTRLDSLGLPPPSGNVDLIEGGTVVTRIAVPSWRTIRASLCPDSVPADRPLVVGAVRDGDGRARVTLRWTGWGLRQEGKTALTSENRREMVVQPNAAGWFRACGLPTDVAIEVWAEGPGGVSDTVRVRLAEGQLHAQELALRPREPAHVLPAVEATALSAETRRARAEASSHVNGLSRAEIDELQKEGATRVRDLLQHSHFQGVRVHPYMKDNFAWGICVESSHASRSGRTGCRMVMVIIDGARMPDDEAARVLATLRASDVEALEYLPPTEATFRFGTMAGSGALILATRR